MKQHLPIEKRKAFTNSKVFGFSFSVFFLALILSYTNIFAQVVTPNIRIDQFGYPINARKVAVISNPVNGYNNNQTFVPGAVYEVRKTSDNSVVYTGMPAAWKGGQLHTQSGDKAWWFDFSNLTTPGSYYILDVSNNRKSYEFNIGDDVYNNVANAASKMFYYNRRGFAKSATYAGIWADNSPAFNNPNQDLTARDVTDKTNASTEKDVSGGWFDAGDYNKYVNFTFSVFSDMLLAYEEKPSVWSDNTNIPESGNGVPDLLDEIKWEMDWMLRMQNSNGSLMSKVGNAAGESMNELPPSNITRPQYYGPASTSATLTGAMAFALGAIQYKSLTSNTLMVNYGNNLQTAAINAWNWADANPSVLFVDDPYFDSADPEVDNYTRLGFKIAAAAYLYALTGNSTYKTFFDANYENLNCVKASGSFTSLYEQHFQDAVLYYAKTFGATPSVVSNIKARLENSLKNQSNNLPAFTSQEDAYRSHLNDGDFNWGSSKIKSCAANNLGSMILNAIDVPNTERYREAAMGYIHYIHGTNATGFSFLTNMQNYGAENPVTKMYHSWFGAFGTFSGNTPPGYLVGGVNKTYQPSSAYTGNISNLTPPLGQPAAKAYKDWDTSFPENSWEITEPAIYYQAAYLRMLAKAIGGLPAPPSDVLSPSAPTSLSTSNLLPTSFTLNWSASTDNIDVVAYEIYNNGTKILESTSNIMYLTGLTPNTLYNLTIKAKDRAGNLSDASSLLNVTTPELDTTPPTTPTNVMASNTTQIGSIITWTASTDNLGVTQYEVYKDGVIAGTTPTLVFPLAGLSANTTYSITVKAKDAAGNSSDVSVALSLTTTNTVSPDKVIFDETFGAGWQNGGWVTTDWASTNPKRVGNIAAKASHEDNWQAIGFETISNADIIYTNTYPKGFGFWAYAEGTGSVGYYLKAFNAENIEMPSKQFNVPAGVWTYIRTDWSEIGNPMTIKRIWLQGNGSSIGKFVSFDDVRFLYSDPVIINSDKILYDEAILANWNDWNSYNNTRDLNSSVPVAKKGSKAMKVTATDAWGAVVLSGGSATDAINTADYPNGIGFWAYYEGTTAVNTKIETQNIAGTSGTPVEKLISAGAWNYVHITWAELGNPTEVNKVIIQDLSGQTSNIKNYDDIRFLYDVPVTSFPDKVLYNETLLAGWNNWSWASVVNFDNTSPVKIDSKSLKVTYGSSYQGLSFQSSSDVINTVDFSKGIGFWAYAEGSSAIPMKINTENSVPTPTPQFEFSVPAGTWTYIRVNWSDLGNPTQVGRVTIQEASGNDGNVVYFDDIKFLANEPVLPTDQIIYADALGADWQNWSYDGTDWDFTNTTTVKVGTNSIKGSPAGAYKAASFNKGTVVSTSEYPGGIGFWAFGETPNGTNTTVKLKLFSQPTSGGTNSTEKVFELPLGTWTYVKVLWSDLGNPTDIQRINIQDNSGAAGQIFYFDDIRLLADAPPSTAAVTFSPAGGTFGTAQMITLNTATSGATIKYTTNGDTPSESVGTEYTGAFNIATTTTVKAIAYKSGYSASTVSEANYIITTIVPSTEIIYDDVLNSSWDNWSFTGTNFNFANTVIAKQGVNSIKGTPTGAWEAISLTKNTVVNPAYHPGGIGFWAYGETANGTNTNVQLQVYTQATSSAPNSTAKSIDLPLGIWTYVNVSWAELGNPTSVQRLSIQDRSGAGGQVFLVDEIKLLEAVPVIPSSQIIYADALGNDWQNWSYDASDWDFNNATQVKVGTKSIKGTPAGAWKAASFNKNTVINTINHPGGIGFWAFGETANGTNTQVLLQAYIQSTSTGTNSVVKSIDLPLGVWTYIHLPWSDFGNPTEIQRFTIQDRSGAAGQVYYFDEIKLLSEAPIASIPSNVMVDKTMICEGANLSLNANCEIGIIKWYDAANGGTLIGSGSPLSITPSSGTKTYFASCDFNGSETSRVATLQVTVNAVPTAPTSISGTLVIVSGGNTSLTANGCSGTVKWYSAANGGLVLTTNNPYSISPTITTTYYAACVNGLCESVSRTAVTVTISPCSDNPTLPNYTTGTVTIKALNTISAANTIASGANVTYQAGKSVTLNPGFNSNNGSVFKAQIGGCN